GLADLGRFVAERAGGSFTALIEAADSSAAALADRLVELAQYRDCAEHDGREVWLAKRAQITAADLHDAFGGAGLGRFHDLARLTMFADNLVPHVLALDGVLAVDPELRAAITREELLPAGGRAEVELRAAAVHAVERLTIEPALRAGNTTAMQLDQLLWRRGGGARYKATPRHRTRCTFY
ncbi:MAG: queuosine salvage family protein, partial [Acidimicrobiales bacterium]